MPARHAVARIVESRMWSRLLTGSASMPSRPSRLVTVVVTRSRNASPSSAAPPAGAANDFRIDTGQPRLAPRRVDDEIRRVAQPRNAAAVLAPLGQALLPQLGLLPRVVLDAHALPPRVFGIDPRREVLGPKLGEREHEVAQVALRVDDDRRDPVDGRLLEQRQAQAGLAAPRHADADGVGDEVARVVEEPSPPRSRFARS